MRNSAHRDILARKLYINLFILINSLTRNIYIYIYLMTDLHEISIKFSVYNMQKILFFLNTGRFFLENNIQVRYIYI